MKLSWLVTLSLLVGLFAVGFGSTLCAEETKDAESTSYEQAVDVATKAYLAALATAQQDATAANDESAVEKIAARIKLVADADNPPVVGQWAWYSGISTIKADGTCHWKGKNHEEHGVWHKAEGFIFEWGEKGNDWNYLSVNKDGILSGKIIRWGNDLASTPAEK